MGWGCPYYSTGTVYFVVLFCGALLLELWKLGNLYVVKPSKTIFKLGQYKKLINYRR